MKLIKETRKGYKLWSVQLGVVALFISLLEPALAPLEGLVPDWAHSVALSVIIAAGILARFLPQPSVHDE
ncbi:hypothetical protein HOP60_09820 [Halomonas daqingensis]|uniref:Holin n=1 Tax=Billgrantia desiderata TaxID=52021 RepID=A0ABS9B4N1_9GAMM|nr:hypothetical protein [Halomonas desiderata]MCE8042450.1 hypothetical protein [Halomonas desiderata]MCE8047025.1 hypothetical protein [Halomonas desiderata]